MRRLVRALVVIGLALGALFFARSQPVSAHRPHFPTLQSVNCSNPPFAPDFDCVADILGGRRRLFPVDDVAVSYSIPNQAIFNYIAVSEPDGLAVEPVYNPYPDPDTFSTGIGRMFNLPYDVVATIDTGQVTLATYGNYDFQTYTFPSNASATPNLNQFPAADFTGDGYTDFAYIQQGSIYILTAADVNDITKGVFISDAGIPPFDVSNTWAVLAAGDFDGNGVADVALAAEQNGNSIVVVVFTVQTTTDNGKVTDIALTNAGSGTLDIPSSIINMAMTAGVFSGTANPNTGIAQDELAILYQYLTDAHHVELQSVQITPQSTDPSQFDVAFVDSTELIDSGVPLSYIDVESDYLNFYSQTEQIVTMIQEQDYNAYMGVYTVDSGLNLNQAYYWKDEDRTHIHTMLALGNFDQMPDASGPVNLQIASLNLDVALEQDNCGFLSVTAIVHLYQVDPSNNFYFSEFDSTAISACYVLDGNQPIPVMAFAAGDTLGRSLFLGPPTKVVAQHIQPEIVLGMPPMHVDWATPANGNGKPTLLNVSAVPDGFYSSYQTAVTNQAQSSRQSTTSFSTSLTEKISQNLTLGVPLLASVSVDTTTSASQMWQNSTTNIQKQYSSKSFNASTNTGFDDQLWYVNERHNIYIYPVIGQVGCPVDNPNCNASEKIPLNVMFSGPDQISPTSITGSLVEWYQPVREPGNVFSYPWNLSQLQALEPNLDLLTSPNPTQFYTDGSVRVEQVSWANQSSQAVTTGSVKNYSWDKSVSISMNVGIEDVVNIGGGGSYSFDYNGSKSFSTLNSSTTTLGQSTGVGVNKPGTFANPGEYAYAILPFIYGTNPTMGTIQSFSLGTDIQTNGILRSEFAADPTDPNAGPWWLATYTQPDVALNHPSRWFVQSVTSSSPGPNCLRAKPGETAVDCAIFNKPQSDLWLSEFYWMKGLYITPASANGDGPQINEAMAGDDVLLQARVYNYSLADMSPNTGVTVQFYGQPWDPSTLQPAGEAFLIDQVGLEAIPGFNSNSTGGTEPNWRIAQTTKLNTAQHSDQHLAFWVLVWITKNGKLQAEMPGHGLTTLPGTLNSLASVASLLQPYSNNVGLYKSLFYIAPESGLGQQASGEGSLSISNLRVSKKPALLNQKIEVSALLHASGDHLDGLTARFFDRARGERQAFEAEQVSRVRAEDVHQLRVPYRPTTCGEHTISLEVEPTGATARTNFQVTVNAGKAVKKMEREAKKLELRGRTEGGLLKLIKDTREAFAKKYTAKGLDLLKQVRQRVEQLRGQDVPQLPVKVLLAQIGQVFDCVKG